MAGQRDMPETRMQDTIATCAQSQRTCAAVMQASSTARKLVARFSTTKCPDRSFCDYAGDTDATRKTYLATPTNARGRARA